MAVVPSLPCKIQKQKQQGISERHKVDNALYRKHFCIYMSQLKVFIFLEEAAPILIL